MSTKRTDKILDLLDGALQSTSPKHYGSEVSFSSEEMCVGCMVVPPIEGRSWCERCLPERQPEPPDEPGADDEVLDHFPGFDYTVSLIDHERPVLVTGCYQIILGDDPSRAPVAGVFVDGRERPIGIGIDRAQFMALADIEPLMARILDLFVGLGEVGPYALVAILDLPAEWRDR